MEVVENGDESRAAWVLRRVPDFVDEGEAGAYTRSLHSST